MTGGQTPTGRGEGRGGWRLCLLCPSRDRLSRLPSHSPPSFAVGVVSFLSRPPLPLLCVKTCPGQQWARTDPALPEPVHRLPRDIRFDTGFVLLGGIHVHTACAVPDGQQSDSPCAHHRMISKMSATPPSGARCPAPQRLTGPVPLVCLPGCLPAARGSCLDTVLVVITGGGRCSWQLLRGCQGCC